MKAQLQVLKTNRDFRLLYTGQFISFLGSMISYVAVPYQIYELTQSSAQVGLLSLVQLVPVIIFGLIGGSVADRVDRRKLMLISEVLMAVGCFALVLNSLLPTPSVFFIFCISAFIQSVNGFHRPSMEALNQKLVTREQYGALASLNGFRHSMGAVIGPSIGGILISFFSLKWVYVIDFLTFFIAIICILKMSKVPHEKRQNRTGFLADMKEGLSFAWQSPVLKGTYMIDMIAMTFAFPLALFPALGTQMGGADKTGYLYSAIPLGSLIVSLFSHHAQKISHKGRGVFFSAVFWGIGIALMGLKMEFAWLVLWLVFAGAADMMSGVFRAIIWNEIVPNEKRGRLAGIEMISYMAGPLLGNARVGWMAAKYGDANALSYGGVICCIACILVMIFLRRFWSYQSAKANENTSHPSG